MTKLEAEYISTLRTIGELSEPRECVKCKGNIKLLSGGTTLSIIDLDIFWKKHWYWCLSCLQTESLLPTNSDEESTTLGEKP